MLTIIVFLTHNLIIMFSIKCFIGAIFVKTKTSKPVLVGSYLLYWISSSLAFLLLYTPEVILAIRFLTTFMITLNYVSLMRRRLVVTSYFYVLILSIEVLIGFVFINRFDNVPEDILYYSAISLISFICMLFFHRYQNLKEDTSPSRFWTASFSITFVLLAMIVMSMLYLPQEYAVIAALMITTINLLNSVVHDTLSEAYVNRVKLEVDATEKKYYLSQLQLMQQSAEQIKTIRHDMKMHLSAIQGYSAESKTNEISDYVANLLGDITASEVFSSSGNLAFDSIINFKLNKARSENIKLDTTLLIPPTPNIEVPDIVTILGNLLDNAMEAVANAENKLIRLTVKYSKGNLVIKVDNTFDGVVKYKNRRDEAEKIIATRKNAGDHGHGLKNICRSVEKYNGTVDISYDSSIFSVTVMLYLDNV